MSIPIIYIKSLQAFVYIFDSQLELQKINYSYCFYESDKRKLLGPMQYIFREILGYAPVILMLVYWFVSFRKLNC